MWFFVWFLIILFDSLHSSTLHKHTMTNNNTIFLLITIFRGEFTMLIQQKYGFKVYVISINFYSAHIKVYIHLPCINTHPQKTASFDITNIISYREFQIPRLYKGSANFCEGDRNSDRIRLLRPYQTIQYCNQSVLAIVPDLNIFVWSVTIIVSICRSALVQFFSIICYLFV